MEVEPMTFRIPSRKPPASGSNAARFIGGSRHAVPALLWLLHLVALAGIAAAQDPTISLPPTLILPNYDRVQIGQREGLEAGAFVARTDDASAAWYNPADSF
jgi:hypothetical protein